MPTLIPRWSSNNNKDSKRLEVMKTAPSSLMKENAENDRTS